MCKLVIASNPTDPFFNLYVFKEKDKVESTETTVNNLEEILSAFMKKYQIVEVHLAGAKPYMEGVEKLIRENDHFHYSTHEVIIKYI